MPKPTFHLKDPKADKETSVFLLYTCSDGRLKYYTGESIDPQKWELKTKPLRAVLNRFTDTVNSLEADYKIKGEVLTREKLKAHLDVLRDKPEREYSLFERMRMVIEQMKEGHILTPQKKRYAKGSIKALNYTIGLLERFRPGLKNVSIETYKEFIHYCHGKNYSTNYIGGQIKNWKTLGNLTGGTVYNQFKILKEETFDVYLDEKELKLIYDYKVTNRQERARDWFIIGCYTGLRVSDLTRLVKKNYRSGFITISNEKTDEIVTIPAHPLVKSIIEKWKGFPPKVSDQEINRTIKVVAQKAGIKGSVLVTMTKGGVRKDDYKEKWEMISAHSGRRSFITNMRKMGVPDTIVMKLSGIKSHSTLKKYDKLTSEEAAKIAAGLEFFK